ncbi:hypothetical protein KSF_098890 [Reticulibacter mediterranei]|uniref:Uncharacterized protein n=1 Tax=Reticulibacter mediterranei TaxID=2778369 RepID=A0A8J3J1E8_9CHLR|nr:hypothetical protein [Reticulibacter mediterranei]GHO99841.1 hypothetical protein KSF_098890 [Reticulibacter mediterranei]
MSKHSPTWLARATVQVADPKNPAKLMPLWGQGVGDSEKEAKQDALRMLQQEFERQFGSDWRKIWGKASRVRYETDIQRHL